MLNPEHLSERMVLYAPVLPYSPPGVPVVLLVYLWVVGVGWATASTRTEIGHKPLLRKSLGSTASSCLLSMFL